MNSHYQIIGLVAGIFSIVGYVFYARSLLAKRKDIKPNITSWILWTISYILICTSYYFSGARQTIWVPLIYALANIVILFLIFKKGHFEFNFFEKILLGITVFSVVIWIIFNSPFLALVINMGIDGIAIIPTVLKVYKKPFSEDKTAWFFFSLADITNIFAIQKWNLHIALYPIVAAIFCLVTFIFLYRKNDKK